MQVKDILAKKQSAAVVTVSPDLSVHDAAIVMNEKSIGAVVVARRGEVVGIFTERDVLRRVVAPRRDPSTVAVGDVMTTPLVACTTETTLDACRRLMSQRRIRHLPIVDGGLLSGIVTIGDLLAQQLEEQQCTIECMHDYLYSDAAPLGA